MAHKWTDVKNSEEEKAAILILAELFFYVAVEGGSGGVHLLKRALYVFEHGNGLENQILKFYDEIAIPVESLNSEVCEPDLTGLQSDRRYSVKKDLITGEETTIYEEDFASQNIDKTEYVSEGVEEYAGTLPAMPLSYADWVEYNPQNYPTTKSIFKLYIHTDNGIAYGTGFKVGGMHIATSGHCVYDPAFVGNGGYANNILCIPSWRTSEPYQPLGNSWAASYEVGGDWRNSQDRTDDWGVVELASTVNTGYMAKRSVGDNTSIDGIAARIAGYPGSGNPMTLSWGYTLNTSRRMVTADYTSAGSQSGSPILDANNYIIGIHRGKDSSSTPEFVKFDSWIFNKMASY